ncbi:hypothetical protein B296_00008953 [Ensete ventricosum]|uniref:FAD-binding domain-containing protein n=1 Tax=Ensete ventricosum TaxID=4639 RepID=A0A427AH82_ENSVE|nr:hypothetical protein B296_00008953 [Ensete ventricosum]
MVALCIIGTKVDWTTDDSCGGGAACWASYGLRGIMVCITPSQFALDGRGYRVSASTTNCTAYQPWEENRSIVGNLRISEKLSIYCFVGQVPLLEEYPEEVIEIVKHCNIDPLSFNHIRHGHPWHLGTRDISNGPMTVAEDALHAMGPFPGEGGSIGLEDAIVLARFLVPLTALYTGSLVSSPFSDFFEHSHASILRLLQTLPCLHRIPLLPRPFYHLACLLLDDSSYPKNQHDMVRPVCTGVTQPGWTLWGVVVLLSGGLLLSLPFSPLPLGGGGFLEALRRHGEGSFECRVVRVICMPVRGRATSVTDQSGVSMVVG